MEEIGIIPCYDMTVEAAYAKLVVICGMTRQSEERAEVIHFYAMHFFLLLTYSKLQFLRFNCDFFIAHEAESQRRNDYSTLELKTSKTSTNIFATNTM